MARRADTDVEEALAKDRRHLAEWRSTPDGEADYQVTVERMKSTAARLRANR